MELVCIYLILIINLLLQAKENDVDGLASHFN
jgi:hypothetical protein